MKKNQFIYEQVIPIGLTVVVFAILVLFLLLEILGINIFSSEKIQTHFRLADILVGLTIYLKTSVDFAIFMGRLMAQNTTWKDRVAIEVGTALGNALGTFAILLVWSVFKEVAWLLAVMIFIATLVLIKLSEESFEHAAEGFSEHKSVLRKVSMYLLRAVRRVNAVVNPVLRYVVPTISTKEKKFAGFFSLFIFSFSIPFILGLDDFAGYVPLFNVVNVFGFSIGVFLGHMLLNIFLFLSPARTIRVVKNNIISLLGGGAFILLALWGVVESIKLLTHG